MKGLIAAILLACLHLTCHAQPGALDSSFGLNGIAVIPLGYSDGVNSLIMDPDNKILAAGGSDGAFTIVRCKSNGSLDKTFGVLGKDTINYNTATSMALQTDGKILSCGINFFIARYLTSGSLDTSFNGTGKVPKEIPGQVYCYSIALQPDGKILLGGESDSKYLLARFDSNGMLDSTFNNVGYSTMYFGVYGSVIHSVVVQPTGKIVVAGYYYNECFKLLRYNTDGSVDSTFGNSNNGIVTTTFDSGHYPVCNVAILQPDGKILAAGSSQQPNSDDDFAIARYSADGVPDSSFGINGKVTADIDTGESDIAYGMALQADGKIILAGRSYGAVESVFALARFNIDGKLDSTFGRNGKVTTSVEGYDDRLYSIVLQPDGKIVVGGSVIDSTNHNIAHTVLARYSGGDKVEVNNIKRVDGDIQIFPNPSSGEFTIRKAGIEELTSFEICDISGRKLYTQMLQNKDEIKLSLNLAPGVYIVRLEDSTNRQYTRRLVIY